MSEPDIISDLLELARGDLAAASALSANEQSFEIQVGFLAQQAVEKALKAAIAGRGSQFPMTHNLRLLIQICEDEGLEVPDALQAADRLTPYAATVRYGLGDPSSVAPADAIRWADSAIQWAESQAPRP